MDQNKVLKWCNKVRLPICHLCKHCGIGRYICTISYELKATAIKDYDASGERRRIISCPGFILPT